MTRSGSGSGGIQPPGGGVPPPSGLPQAGDIQALNTSIQAMSDGVKVNVDTLNKLIDSMKASADDTARSVRRVTDSLGDAIDYYGDLDGMMKAALKTQKEMLRNKGGFTDPRNLEASKKIITGIVNQYNEMLTFTRAGSKEHKEISKQLKAQNDLLGKIGTATTGRTAENEKLLDDVEKTTKEYIAQSYELSKLKRLDSDRLEIMRLQKVALASMGDKLRATAGAFNAAFGGKPGSFFTNSPMGSVFRGLGAGSRVRGYASDAKERLAEQRIERERAGRELYARRSEAGTLPSTSMMDKLVGKLVKGTKAQQMLEIGGGSLSKGLGSTIANVAGGGLSGLAGMLGKASPLITAGQALAAVYDKRIEGNKKMISGLGDNGLFAGVSSGNGGGVSTRLGVMRDVLNSSGAMSNILSGRTFEDNLGALSSVMKGGGLGNASQFGLGLKSRGGISSILNTPNSGALGPGMMSNVMHSAMTNDVLGLSADQSAQASFHLINQYKESAQGTTDFFLKMEKQLETSGVSATKYLSILDEITGSFNQLNRSLHATMTILHAVGKTGRYTGDRMSEIAKGLSAPSGGSTAQSMVAYQHFSDTDWADLQKAIEGDLSTLKSDSAKSFGVKDWGSMSDNEIMNAMELRIQNATGDDRLGLQSAKDKFMNRTNSLAPRMVAIKNKDAFAMGSMSSNDPEMYSSTVENYTKMKTAAAQIGVSMKDLLNPTTRAEILGKGGNKEALEKLHKAFGLSGSLSSTLDAIHGGSEASIGGMLSMLGDDKADIGKKETLASRLAGVAGVKFAPGQATGAMREYLKSDKNRESLMDKLRGTDEITKLMSDNTDYLGGIQKKMDEANALAKKTSASDVIRREQTDLAEIFHRTFEYLFQKLISSIEKLVSFGDFGDKGKAYAQQAKSLVSGLGGTAGLSDELARQIDVLINTDRMTEDDYNKLRELVKKAFPGGVGEGAIVASDQPAYTSLGEAYRNDIKLHGKTDKNGNPMFLDLGGDERYRASGEVHLSEALRSDDVYWGKNMSAADRIKSAIGLSIGVGEAQRTHIDAKGNDVIFMRDQLADVYRSFAKDEGVENVKFEKTKGGYNVTVFYNVDATTRKQVAEQKPAEAGETTPTGGAK